MNAVRFTGENVAEVVRFAQPHCPRNVYFEMDGKPLLMVRTPNGIARINPWDWVIKHADGSVEVVDQIEFMRRQGSGY